MILAKFSSCGIIRRTVRSIFILHIHFTKAKIAQGDVARVIEEDVLRLEISIDHIEAMEAF